MNKVCYMDEEILKMQIVENSKLIDEYLKELREAAIRLASKEKAAII